MNSLTNFQNSSNTLLRFFHYSAPIWRKKSSLLIGSFFALFLQVFMTILQPWPLKFILDRFFSSEVSQTSSGLGFLETFDSTTIIIISAVSLGVIFSLRAIGQYYSMVGFAKVGTQVMTKMRTMLFRHIQMLSLSFHSKAKSGDLVLRVMSDVSMMKDLSSTALMPLIGNILIFVGILAVMFWINWQLALLVSSIIPIFFFFSMIKGKKIRRLSRKQKKRLGAMANTASESIVAIKEIQALSLKDTFLNKFSDQGNQDFKQDVKIKKEESGLVARVDVLIGIATSMVLGYGGILVLEGTITPGDWIIFLFYVGGAFRPMRKFATYVARLSKSSAACERILEILEQKPDVHDLPDAKKAPSFRGDIHFDNVSFAYEEGFPILKNISFTIPKGSSVALVGTSGEGKSTIVNLILRLYDCTSGRILIDDHDIRDYTLDSFRRQINVVQQDNMLFSTTVAENISYGAIVNENYSSREPTKEEIQSVSQLANAHNFINSLPNGYETVLAERGSTLSRGQRQRIALARAALGKTPILILDEPTTGLDEENERLVMESVQRLEKDCTVLLITHNLKYASRSDLILFLDKGELVESGTHDELISKNQKYASLFKLQTLTSKGR